MTLCETVPLEFNRDMHTIGQLLILALEIYFWIIIIAVVVSWLVAFEVINARNPQAQRLLAALNRATEPVFAPLRRYIPPIGGIDITPFVVIVIIALLTDRIIPYIFFY